MTDERELPAGDDDTADDTAGHYLQHLDYGERIARERHREAEQQASESRKRGEGQAPKKRRFLFRR